MPQKIKTISFNANANIKTNDVQSKNRKADICFYASKPWRTLRESHIKEHPLCNRCETVTPATHVHHIIERKADPTKELDPNNLESLCCSCHSKHHANNK